MKYNGIITVCGKEKGLPVMPKIELERSAIGPKAKQDMGKLFFYLEIK